MRIYANYLSPNYYNQYKINYQKTDKRAPIKNSPIVLQSSSIAFSGLFNLGFWARKFNKDPIEQFEKFSKEEYLKLTPVQINKLRKEFDNVMKYEPEHLRYIGDIHAYVADCVKTMLDREFGANKYVVIPIGRSLSSISKALELKLGKDNVVNVPMSYAARFFYGYRYSRYKDFYNAFIQKLQEDNGLKTFIKFLNSNKLSKKDIMNSGKNYILMDYCISGNSLRGAKQLFTSDFVWGNKKNNIYAIDLMRLLSNFEDYNVLEGKKDCSIYYNLQRLLENSFYYSEYKPYSLIGRAENLGDTIRASEKICNLGEISRETKLVWFKLLDTIMTNSGKYKAKLNPQSSNEDVLQIPHIHPWNSPLMQYGSDLLSDLNEITKLLIKYDNLSPDSKNAMKIDIKKLGRMYSILDKCYQNKNNNHYRLHYYNNRNLIQKIIDEISSKFDSVVD